MAGFFTSIFILEVAMELRRTHPTRKGITIDCKNAFYSLSLLTTQPLSR